MPFITEEIWQQLHNSSIMTASYPSAEDSFIDEGIESQMETIMDIIKNIRSLRSELNIQPSKEVDVRMKIDSNGLRELIEGNMMYINRLSVVGHSIIGADISRPELSAISVFTGGEMYLPLAGVIDIVKEKGLMGKRLKGVGDEISRIEKKLSNKDFIGKGAGGGSSKRERKV